MNHSLEEVKTIFQEDKQEILSQYSSKGGGIGKDEGTYIIIVYVDEPSKEAIKHEFWKNIPIRFKYVDEIKLQ